jgi:hypothetical protein
MARAAHESGAANDLAACMPGNEFLAAKAVLRRENCAMIEAMSHRSD